MHNGCLSLLSVAQRAGAAYLAMFGVETMVMWHRKWATKVGNSVSRVANILALLEGNNSVARRIFAEVNVGA